MGKTLENISNGFRTMGYQLKKNGPGIMVVFGVIGTIASTILACRATVKAKPVVEEHKKKSKKIKESYEKREFTEKKVLWQNIKDDYVRAMLIQCLTGFRPQELIELNACDVDLEQNIIVGGMKTESGRNRTVPIHSAIKDLVKYQYELALSNGSSKLFFKIEDGSPMSVFNYNVRFKNVIKKYHLNPDHRPHDPRKDFVTEAKRYKVDEYALKRIVGHSIKDITERVYTERDVSWLKEEIEKIKLE